MRDGHAYLNRNAQRIADGMIEDADRLGISHSRGSLGEHLIDAGAERRGGIEAGLRIVEICIGGLGNVSAALNGGKWPYSIDVRSSQPVLACLGSQYAGWNLSFEKYFAMGSGPVRALARVEPLFDEIAYREPEAATSVVILEASTPPPAAIVEKVSKATGLAPDRLTFIYAPTQSLTGSVQIVGRVLEVALHKAHDLKFPLDNIVDGAGRAPIPAPHPDFLRAMGRTNDAIIYGGTVQLFVKGSAQAAQDLAEQLPSHTSRDHGQPFADIFKKFKGDFYAIDPRLFSPAEVIVTAIETGDTFRGGAIHNAMLEQSLG
ncbi:methenyltetrahydromethanopterin cyclohydrolase [Phyllobacterium endophyticum]|uniref:Methenyltetrahydromethanopterin cyclohydrolase n=1 Tax=Phyllobacterium endophyticum TaxID=1149773 RepID=A0A2P7AM87_9HYPH|nr:methenyltetrahydromethanopterin cyclohydrolase [Phyllobacterium endophyticum]MBB3238483.1 methenyltetrahydromethanopterin cyclohydrolase [Phyllobacterium endophyticum]PSH55317.1 methenyltetrahydromethanopterin cyclohydrolase [Phyllobacterium endophyticum]TXR46746.1 methenyltetrahydromethanopterin cyclohydrolase [Phyllobacterium endophyticum]TYR43148.1 methenyltetrahydromethanopterin cyclohydrolase [Phyllobacterium endophyticum]